MLKPKPAKPIAVPVKPERSPVNEPANFVEHPPPKGIPPVRRLSTPKSIDEDKSEIEEEIIIAPTRRKSPSPPPSPLIPLRTIQRNEEYISQPPFRQRSLTPESPPPPPKPRKLDEKWPDFFETQKDDLLPKSTADEPQMTTTKPSRPSMIMFEPSSISTNGNQRKPPTRITTNNVYDFDQAIINLHEGKPVVTPTTKTSVDPFESLFTNNATKSTSRTNGRDDTFTTPQAKPDPFDSLFPQSSSAAADTSTAIKPTLRQIPNHSDKLQRPKVVTNAPKSIPNRTVVEDIEEFVL